MMHWLEMAVPARMKTARAWKAATTTPLLGGLDSRATEDIEAEGALALEEGEEEVLYDAPADGDAEGRVETETGDED